MKNKYLKRDFFQKKYKNKVFLFTSFCIFFFFFISVFSYQIMPEKTPFANNIQLSIAKKSPGFEVEVIMLKKDLYKKTQNPIKIFFLGEVSQYEEVIVENVFQEGATVSFTIYNSTKKETKNIKELYIDSTGSYLKTKKYLLGTDKYGRDLLSRVILGTRVSFSVGFISVFISLLLGVFLGMISGYYGGKVDVFICWLINVVWSIPTLLLVIAISVVLGKGFWQVFVAVGLTMWVEVARVTRGEVLKVSRLPYIEAVKSFGLSDFRIMFRHIFPNIINPIIIISAANFATSILLESGLSFLGIGVQPPIPSWGMIIRNHYGFIVMDKLYLSIIPGICILLLVLSFMLLANSLRDILDKKTD